MWVRNSGCTSDYRGPLAKEGLTLMTNFLFIWLLAFTALNPAQGGTGQQSSAATLRLGISPVKRIFSEGEDVVLIFTICNNSDDPAFVSRNPYGEFIDLAIKDPEGEDIARQEKGPIDSKYYHPEDFTVLKKGECAPSRATISMKNGRGFKIEKHGRYRVVGEYSLGPPEYFAPLAANAKVPAGSFKAEPTTFCLVTCTTAKSQ